MILAIDIGNTNVVIGCIDNENIVLAERIESKYTHSFEEYSTGIKDILEMGNIDIKNIEGSIISSVVPHLTIIFRKAVEVILGTTPFIVGPEFKMNLNILVQNPNQLGSDRIVDAVAAIYYYSKPVIIFDMGTATTVSVVDENHNFLGGMIMLGVKSSLEALSKRTAQLPDIKLEECGSLIGKNTMECMCSGSIYGHAAMIDGIIQRLKKQVGKQATVVATGGLARVIVPYCEEEIIYDEYLLLKGLYLLYTMNCN
ncbi:MAG: type III pantothenate kinase [Ruminiclostridium sp.]